MDIILTQSDGMWSATRGKTTFVSPYCKVPCFKQDRHITVDDTIRFNSLEALARELIVYAAAKEPPHAHEKT